MGRGEVSVSLPLALPAIGPTLSPHNYDKDDVGLNHLHGVWLTYSPNLSTLRTSPLPTTQLASRLDNLQSLLAGRLYSQFSRVAESVWANKVTDSSDKTSNVAALSHLCFAVNVWGLREAAHGDPERGLFILQHALGPNDQSAKLAFPHSSELLQWTLDNRAYCHYRNRAFSEAKRCLETALTVKTGEPTATEFVLMLHTVEILSRLGQHAETHRLLPNLQEFLNALDATQASQDIPSARAFLAHAAAVHMGLIRDWDAAQRCAVHTQRELDDLECDDTATSVMRQALAELQTVAHSLQVALDFAALRAKQRARARARTASATGRRKRLSGSSGVSSRPASAWGGPQQLPSLRSPSQTTLIDVHYRSPYL